MTILVTGARGDVGGAVLAGLVAAWEPVRASSRAPRPGEFPAGVEVARADLTDPASWLAALAGVRKVFPLRASRRRGGIRGRGTECGRGARCTAVLQHGTVPGLRSQPDRTTAHRSGAGAGRGRS
jgi:uncharacterized protein YbjT (DUF2867 family)